MPLTSKEIRFSASACKFSGNELIIPSDFEADKITVKAVLKSNPTLWLEKTIWIKTKPDPELPTKEEVMKAKAKTKSKAEKINLTDTRYKKGRLLNGNRPLFNIISRTITLISLHLPEIWQVQYLLKDASANPRMESKGQVHTSAPASAHLNNMQSTTDGSSQYLRFKSLYSNISVKSGQSALLHPSCYHQYGQ